MQITKSLWYNGGMKRVRKGFTLVELSLSMAFVGVLSLAVIFVINNAVISYRRGNTLSQVNSIGMDIVDDMRAAAQDSSAKSLSNTCMVVFKGGSKAQKDCLKNNANNFVSVTKKEDVRVNDEFIGEVPIYGVFCTGTYSYIWNSGYYWAKDAWFDSKDDGGVSIISSSFGWKSDFRLLKVEDSDRNVCAAAVYDSFGGTADKYQLSPPMQNQINVSNVKVGDMVDLISKEGGADNLALYSLDVAPPATSTENNNVFYSVSFILGTVSGGMNIMSSGSACKAPNDYNSNFDYCAINKFSFAIRATGR